MNGPDEEVRYSQKCLREKHKHAQHTALAGTWLLLICALATAKETLTALRAGEWVDLSARGDADLEIPPGLAMLLVFVLLVGSAYFCRRYLRSRAFGPEMNQP